MKLRNVIISILVVGLLAGAGWAYWYYMMGPKTSVSVTPSGNKPQGYKPIDRNNTSTSTTGGNQTNTGTTVPSQPTVSTIKTLRLLSDNPVGGYGASTSLTRAGKIATTTVRWVDRGRGNVYEARYDSPAITTLSNTVVPKMVSSVWNRNLTAFVGSLFQDGDDTLSSVYAQLIKQSSSSTPSITSNPAQLAPHELRGKNITGDLIGYAASPDKSKLFMFMNESGTGVGYVSAFDGKNMTKLFSTPMTQVNIEWPTDSTITITTKGSAAHNGYMYFVNSKTGKFTKVLGPHAGLSTVTSKDGKYVAYSYTGSNNDFKTSILDVAKKTSVDAVVATFADKCTWGSSQKDVLFCAVPNQPQQAIYPDDWYKGVVATIDKIWQVTSSTGDAKLLSSLIDEADRTINAFNLGTDSKDQYLFFMNKNDLSLWSLDLVSSQ